MCSTLAYTFAPTAAPIRKVKRVQFGILSPDEIVRGIYPKNRSFFLRMDIGEGEEGGV